MKLSTLLKSLQPAEMKEFEKFLQSPFFKASDQYLKFFKFLGKYHPSFELKKADLQTAYRRCFGQQSLTETKLHNLTSGLSKQIEQFLVVQMVIPSDENTECPLYDQLLIKSLGMRNMGPYFRKEAGRLIEETANRPVLETDDYLALQQLHERVYYNPDTHKFAEPQSHLQLALAYLDQYYCITKLRYAAEMKARERILNVHYELPLLDTVLKYSTTPGLMNAHPLWVIYHHLVQLYLQGISEPDFRELITMFTARFHLLPRADQSALLRHLINCGISLIAQDHPVEAELLSLYKLALEADMLLNGQRITHLSFINIVNLASLRQEFDWAQTFVTQFSPYLEESKRQPTIELAKAGIYYNQGLLDTAQTCLIPEIFAVPSFDIVSRMLLSKIVFDRYILYDQDYEFLTAQLKSFERFVQSKALTEEKKEAHLNWIKFVRKMAAIKFETVKTPASKKEILHKKLQQLQPIVARKWLAERIASI